MPYLDGKVVAAEDITPERHRLLGFFRSPIPPSVMPGTHCFVCPCGENLWTLQQIRSHWQSGHFDVPQYETIQKVG